MDHDHHESMHWRCCWGSRSGKGFWVLGALSFLAGVIALWQGGEFWGISYQTWYWTALVSGVLSAGAKGKRHCCGTCQAPAK